MFEMLMTYSPSAGNGCVTTMPPRVPGGAPATWKNCSPPPEVYVVPTGRAFTLPSAATDTVRAAARYWSRKDGDTWSASATLSKPSRASSRGRSSAGSISTPSRSRMALVYSLRFSRWSATWAVSVRAVAAWSRLPSIQETKDWMVGLSGRGLPAGGMRPPRNLRTAFSQVSASSGMLSGVRVSKATPPAQSWVLWHLLQYLSSIAHFSVAMSAGADVPPPWLAGRVPGALFAAVLVAAASAAQPLVPKPSASPARARASTTLWHPGLLRPFDISAADSRYNY